jgi:hypothetical protein
MTSKHDKNKPKITQIKYGRVVSVGNYETVRYELTAEVQPGQDVEEVMERLRDMGLREEKKIRTQRF